MKIAGRRATRFTLLPPADATIRRRYHQRAIVGFVLLALLVPVSVIGSQRSIYSMLNVPEKWVPGDLPELVQWDQFTERFQIGDTILLSWPGATLESPAVDLAAEAIAKVNPPDPHPATIRSVLSGNEAYHRLLDSPTSLPPELAAKRLEGSLVGPDGQQTVIVVNLTPLGNVRRMQVVPQIVATVAEAAGVAADDIRAVGTPVEGAVIDAASIESFQWFAAPSALLAMILCFICLRSLWLTVTISVVAVVSEGLVLGGALLTGDPMNAILIVLPPLVFVLTVSSGIHLSNYFLEFSAEHPHRSAEQSARQALRAGLPPCLLATATTVIGLGSLILVPIVPVRNFGIISAIAVPLSLGLLLLVLPGALLRLSPRTRVPHRASGSHAGERRHAWPIRFPRTVIVAMGLVAILFTLGLGRTETSVSIPRMLPEDHPMRIQYAWFQQHLGPTVSGELAIHFANPGQSNPLDRLALVNRMHLAVLRQPGVAGVLSPGIFLPPPPSGRGFSAAAGRAVIKSQIEEADSNLAETNYLHHGDGSETWRISYRLPLSETTSYADRLRKIGDIVSAIAEQSEIAVSVTSTGEVMLIETAQANLLSGLIRSFAGAFAAVALVMILLLRSIVGGMIAMLPNLFPTIIIFGLLGLIRSPLDIGSVMTASVALGIAVDDTVHLLSRYSSRLARGFNSIEAAAGALRQCAAAMTQTTIVCGCSLMVYSLSDFVPTQRFAWLMLALLAAALLGDLCLLPAMLATRLGRILSRPYLSAGAVEIDADTPEDVPSQNPDESSQNSAAL